MSTLRLGQTLRYWLLAILIAVPLGAQAFEDPYGDLGEVTALSWEDLMPGDFSEEQLYAQYNIDAYQDSDAEAIKRYEAFKQLLKAAPVVEALHGEKISLTGFALPLEGDEKRTTEFLLVPYFGACIHVPPPPANQILLVRSERGITINGLFEPLKVTGRLLIEPASTELADAGYTLELDSAEVVEER